MNQEKPKFYITTAIAYASKKPHFGNTYEAIMTDAYARYKREMGFDVFMCTGTDEHGQKIEDLARDAGITPKAYVDGVADLKTSGKNVVVAGYGWCGKGVAMRAKGLGASVIITEVDPIKALEAVMDGFKVMKMEEAAKVGDFFVTVTGCKDVITEKSFMNMKDGAILCNAGHFDCEVDVAGLKKIAVDSKVARKNIDGYKLSNGNWLYVIGEGRLVNLAAGDGHPAEIMDMSFAIQALSAAYLVKNRGKVQDMVINVPDEIDREVALRKLKFWELEIDTLTEEQEHYLNSWEV